MKTEPRPGATIRVNARLGEGPSNVKSQHVQARTPNAVGRVLQPVPGQGGDTWFVEHDGPDGERVAAYDYGEFQAYPGESPEALCDVPRHAGALSPRAAYDLFQAHEDQKVEVRYFNGDIRQLCKVTGTVAELTPEEVVLDGVDPWEGLPLDHPILEITRQVTGLQHPKPARWSLHMDSAGPNYFVDIRATNS